MGSVFSKAPSSGQTDETVTPTGTAQPTTHRNPPKRLLDAPAQPPTKRRRSDGRDKPGAQEESRGAAQNSSAPRVTERNRNRSGPRASNTNGRDKQGADNAKPHFEDRDEDIRGRVTDDIPVKPEFLIRAMRDSAGKLSLDLQGRPLYEPEKLEEYAESALVIPKAGVLQHADGMTVQERNRLARPHADPSERINALNFVLRKGLRKRQVKFPRSAETLSLFSATLFDTGDLTGAFGVPEKRKVDLRDKLYLAPLTTVGNLPFRRVCKRLGADVTCGEMAMAPNILKANNAEWALLRRHAEEDLFGVQLAGCNVDVVTRAAELIGRECSVDFLEINAGCPIELVFNRGGGCALMTRKQKLNRLVWSVGRVANCPVGVKMRTGVTARNPVAHSLIADVAKAGAQWITVHGRSRKQRYSKLADWQYIVDQCAPAAKKARIPLLGNGDVYNWRDATRYFTGGADENAGVTSVMLARGALIKPWLFKEIKETRDWDIRSGERLDIYKQFAKFGLEHWGSDQRGVETTRSFLLEWLSFLYRYVPIGIVEGGVDDTVVTMSHRAPFFRGRDDLETLLGSPQSKDWVRITEMLLGKAPSGFSFIPKHKSNAWDGGGSPEG